MESRPAKFVISDRENIYGLVNDQTFFQGVFYVIVLFLFLFFLVFCLFLEGGGLISSFQCHSFSFVAPDLVTEQERQLATARA